MRVPNILYVVSAACLVVGFAGPASAADARLQNGNTIGSYDDSADNLCVNVLDGSRFYDFGTAEIVNPNNGNVRHRISTDQNEGRKCTGNLSIPEDMQFILRVTDCSRLPEPSTPCGPSRQVRFNA